MLCSDVVLFVVDSTLDPTENLRDDFRLLARSGIPLIPLFNFTANGNTGTAEWETFLKDRGYFLYANYDAHYYRRGNEQRLYELIGVLLKDDLHRKFFDLHVGRRELEELKMQEDAVAAMADMLIDCVACRRESDAVDQDKKASYRGAVAGRIPQDD